MPLLFLILNLLLSCGIPSNIALAPPVAMDKPSAHILGFQTANDANILGYVLYYKIYTDQTDYYEQDDEKYFDENTYIDSDEELQPGDVVPIQRNYLQVGEQGKQILPSNFLFDSPGSNLSVYIDFGDYDAPFVPKVGYVNPIGPVEKYLARGFIDPTILTDPKPLLSFVNDWDFVDGDAETYTDGDLRRKTGSGIGKQPGETLADIEDAGTPLFSTNIPPVQILIGFVTYAFGMDPVTLQPLTSKPVFIGKIGYRPINDVDRVDRN